MLFNQHRGLDLKLLMLTNFYPPISRGGYEQWCQEITDELRNRGHEITVLTSTHGRDRLQTHDPEWVRRDLWLEMEFASFRNSYQFFTSRKKREEENLSTLRHTIDRCAPDAVLIWGMWNLHRSLPDQAEKLMPGKVVYYLGDYWPTLPSQFMDYWNAPARDFITGFPKFILRPIARRVLAKEGMPALQLEHTLFPSVFLRDELMRKGLSLHDSRIIYGAIDTRPYLEQKGKEEQNDITSLLYIGRLTQEKGVHTAIEAVAYLVYEFGLRNLMLTIVGNGDSDYVDSLYQLVKHKKIGSFVKFIPAQPKETLPSLYRQFDILLFTSIWPEPFGRVIVEAMASGLAVAGTPVGGAAEILADEENSLTYTPGDPASLACLLKRLIVSPELLNRLAETGRNTAVARFDIQRMASEIEAYLQALVE